MARPRRSHHTRAALLDKGLQLFTSQGYHGTGLAQVLGALEVPKGSFYNFFASKEAFVAEVIGLYAARLHQLLEAHLAAWQGSTLDGLREAWRLLAMAHEANGLEDGCLVANLSGEVTEANTLCRAALSESMLLLRGSLVEALTTAQAAGEVRADHSAEDLADFLWDAWEGSLLRAKVERSAAPLHRTIRLLFDHVLPVEPS